MRKLYLQQRDGFCGQTFVKPIYPYIDKTYIRKVTKNWNQLIGLLFIDGTYYYDNFRGDIL